MTAHADADPRDLVDMIGLSGLSDAGLADFSNLPLDDPRLSALRQAWSSIGPQVDGFTIADLVSGGDASDALMGGPGFDDVARANRWAESRHRPDAEGPITRYGDRAYGEGQLRAPAVVDYARAHGLPTDASAIQSLMRDPEMNPRIADWYLQQQFAAFGGDTDKALAAYNWGPGNVRRLGDGFSLDRLPPETRNHIARVRARLGDGREGMMESNQDFEGAYGSLMNYAAGVGAMGDTPPPAPRAGIGAMAGPPMERGASGLRRDLSPYLQLVDQLTPRPSSIDPLSMALMQGGARMMASRRPDFLGALGEGLGAGLKATVDAEAINRADALGRLKLGADLYRADQRQDATKVVPKGGALWVPGIGFVTNPNGSAGDPLSPMGKLAADLKAGNISRDEYDAQVRKMNGETIGEVGQLLKVAGIEPGSPEAQKYARDILSERARNKGETTRRHVETVDVDGVPTRIMFDADGNRVADLGKAASPSGGNRPTDFQLRYDLYIKAGKSPEEASKLAYNPTAASRSLDPQKAYLDIQKIVAGDLAVVPKDRKAVVDQRFREVFGYDYQPPGGRGSPVLPPGGGVDDSAPSPRMSPGVEPPAAAPRGFGPRRFNVPPRGAAPTSSTIEGAPPASTGYATWGELRSELAQAAAAGNRAAAIQALREAGVTDEQIRALGR